MPRGFMPPSGPSLDFRLFQVSHRIDLITTLFSDGMDASVRSCSTGIRSALETPKSALAMPFTVV